MDNSNNTSSSSEISNSTTQPADIGSESSMTRELNSKPKYYIFLVTYLVLMSALGSFVNDMYSPALPAMCKFFGCTVSIAQMGLTMGMIGLSIGQLVLGPVSDKYGRLPVLYGSLSLFIIAAVVSIFSPNIHIFNLCRMFQGIGASGGYFLARTIPADIYSGRPLAKLMALIGAINGIAPASAPIIGGVTADAWGWKGVFAVLCVFAVIVLVIGIWMKESLAPDRRSPDKWWHAFRGYKSLLTNGRFMTHVAFKGLALGMLFAYIAAMPFILQKTYGLSQTIYGLVIGFNAIFMAAGSMLALKFHPLKKAASAGTVIMIVGVIGEAIVLYTLHNLWVFEAFAVVIMLGLGMIFSTTNTLAMNEGRSDAGDASSVLGISGYVVGAVVSPLAGLGNILHSTAILYIVLAALIAVAAILSRRIAPDLNS
ncbi:MAG: multidrug effflux MFS transporter [Muribaculaceae bacterium]|nr:multidrug effflux MFS transporter [Muribaculaceae bacterium]